MAVIQASASLAGFGALGLYGGAHPSTLIIGKAYNSVSGVSAPPEWASGPPGPDPVVAALDKVLTRQWGNHA
jgi:hypothetical protein